MEEADGPGGGQMMQGAGQIGAIDARTGIKEEFEGEKFAAIGAPGFAHGRQTGRRQIGLFHVKHPLSGGL